MDDNIGMDMKELKRIIEASELCEKEEAKEKLMGTGSDWKPGTQFNDANWKYISSQNIFNFINILLA